MDTTDLRLIDRLKIDARASITTLAADLGITRATVKTRLDRLVASGAIRKFTVDLDESVDSDTIRAITMIRTDGNLAKPIIRALRAMPQVTRLHTTNGTWDLVAEVEVNTLPQFDRTLTRIGEIRGVVKSETCLLLDTAKG